MKSAKSIVYVGLLLAVFISIILIAHSSAAQSSALRISKSGTGGGTSSPRGIDCGSDCTEIYSTETKPINVTLSAKADSISYFAGWSGACTGTKSTCTLAMDTDKDVMANFAPNPILNITKSGDGQGVIKSAPLGVNCGVDCSSGDAQYRYGLRVTLIVKTDLYSTFLGWTEIARHGE